jgi:carboxypeptidase C (cathepsin A)
VRGASARGPGRQPGTGSGTGRRALVALLAAAALALAACGGGGGGGADAPPPDTGPPLKPGELAYDDPQAYSSAGSASLAGAEEAAAVTKHGIVLGGQTIAYTARAGHVIARHPLTNAAQAAMFHVSYTADGAAAATRPVTFFYNGGPGSASIWLHLGSFGPKRLATGVPATTLPRPFALVDNAESLLDTTDMVFVNAVSVGRSQAIAPFTNASFWGVDADAALFRDFVQRWLAVHGRAGSPKFLFGESYGGPRTAVLARLLQEAGVVLAGVVLQSPAMDYNSNCGVTGQGNCHAHLPTYAAIGAWHGRTNPVPTDLDAAMDASRSLAATRVRPAIAAWQAGQTPLPADLPPTLAAHTGLPAMVWQQQPNVTPGLFMNQLLPGSIVGRYDGRIAAVLGTALAAGGDPSGTLVSDSFATAIGPYLRDVLRYRNDSTYVLLSNAIASWNFGHAGRALPDTLPDLQAALDVNPALRVLAQNGYHDLATPFHVTELDLARLNAPGRVLVRNYPGGHMTYLDDATRVRQKADLVAFYAGTLAALAAETAPRATRLAGTAQRPGADRAGTPPVMPQRATPEPALQRPMLEPWAPPQQVQRAWQQQPAPARAAPGG